MKVATILLCDPETQGVIHICPVILGTALHDNWFAGGEVPDVILTPSDVIKTGVKIEAWKFLTQEQDGEGDPLFRYVRQSITYLNVR